MDAALDGGGRQVSSQNWGTASGLAATVAGASDAYASGLTVDFRGGLAASGDTLYLRGFTVVRWP